MFEFLTDLVRMAHLACFAIGIGSAVFMEGLVLSRARIQIDLEELALVERGHRVILTALGGLWATGLILIAIRTGLDPAAFTPKLQAKLAVVMLLTANALLMAWTVIPVIQNALYASLREMESWELGLIGGVAGFSAAGWFGALLLGALGHLKSASPEALWLLFAALMMTGASVGVGMALRAGRIGPEEPLLPLHHFKSLLGSRPGGAVDLHSTQQEEANAPISNGLAGRA